MASISYWPIEYPDLRRMAPRGKGPIDERTGERLPVGGPVELEPPEWDHLMVGAAAGGGAATTSSSMTISPF